MFNIKELTFIQNVLKSTESQDEMTLDLIDKIKNIIEIANECKECLWSFHWSCGRQGDLDGLFKATKEEVKNVIGKTAYFGEVLGKHSEVYGTLEEHEIELVSDDPIKVMNSEESGFNPLNYVQYHCDKCNYDYYMDEYDVEKNMCCYCVHEVEQEGGM